MSIRPLLRNPGLGEQKCSSAQQCHRCSFSRYRIKVTLGSPFPRWASDASYQDKWVMLTLASGHATCSVTRRKSATASHDVETKLASASPAPPLPWDKNAPLAVRNQQGPDQRAFSVVFKQRSKCYSGQNSEIGQKEKNPLAFPNGKGGGKGMGIDRRLEACKGLWEKEGRMI